MKDSKLSKRLDYFIDLFSNRDLSIETDGSTLLSLARKFSKVESRYREEKSVDLIQKKIALLGSTSIEHFMESVKLFLYQDGILPSIYRGGYGDIVNQIFDSDSELYRFQPDILIILTDYRDIKNYPPLFAPQDEINEWVEEQTSFYRQLWDKVAEGGNVQIIQSTFVTPIERFLGNLEVNYSFSQTNCINQLNFSLTTNKPTHVSFFDLDYMASFFGKRAWFSEKDYFFSKQGFSFDAFGLVATNLSSMVSSICGQSRKCLVLDLDNTLWGGVIGDDGLEGINISPNDVIGEAFLHFQSYVKKLKSRGVILAVCSKNEKNIALQPFQEHPDMVLRLDDISCFIANWQDKARNIREIAEELNIGLDGLVFFDDNPAEREIVKQYLPEVAVVDVPDDPVMYVRALEENNYFDWSQLGKEDINRSESYVQNRNREKLKSRSGSYEDYLTSLEMRAKIDVISELEQPRFTQLINKTNQFNFRTKRYTPAEIATMSDDPNQYRLVYLSLKDKFSNYGLIACVILKKKDDTAFIDTWVMSCRVFKRNLEYITLNYLKDSAREWGCQFLEGEYLPTAKNALIKDLFPKFGFEHLKYNQDETGDNYRLDLNDPNKNDLFKYIYIEN